ncbi:MAG: ABC transporter permease subunit [Myxococcaceae bacterium]|nr:MAG: ABC transporter permease subunit [Myxococcaceae bacterium]
MPSPACAEERTTPGPAASTRRSTNIPGLREAEPGRAAPAARALLRRRRVQLLLVGAFLAWSIAASDVSPGALVAPEALHGLGRLLRGMVPPDVSLGFLGVVAVAVGRTLAIGIAGTALAVLLAVPLGILATPRLFRPGALAAGRGPWAVVLFAAHLAARATLRVFRAVPDLLWALLFVVAVGLGPRAGALALGVSYAGVLGRVFADLLEDVEPSAAEALVASGGRRASLVLFALVPQALPGLVSYGLYSLECAIRSASVLGFVGAGGIGQEIQLSMRLFEYRQVSTLLLALLGLMLAGEAASRLLRRATRSVRVTGRPPLTGRGRKLVTLATLVAVVLSFRATELLGSADDGLLARMGRFAAQLFPPDLSLSFLAALREPLLQTLAVAGAGTLLGMVLAAALAPLASAGLMLRRPGAPGRPGVLDLLARLLHVTARSSLAVLRAIPELLWVLLCIVAVGFGPFAGVLALGLHTAGVLGRLWAEALDEAPADPVEVLEAAGASAPVWSLWGAWPQARPLVASYGLLRWEFNLRVSALVGFLGGGGLGLRLYNAIQLGFYDQVSTTVLLILGLVMLSDAVSDAVRRSWLAPATLRRDTARPVDSSLALQAGGLAA